MPNYQAENIIGCDESGVGDYLTPLVGCAVYIKPEQYEKLKNWNIKDSKKIKSNEENEKIAEKLRKEVIYHVVVISQEHYNALTSIENMHADEIKTLLHLKAIYRIFFKSNKTIPNTVPAYIDNYVNNDIVFHNYSSDLVTRGFVKGVYRHIELIKNGEKKHLAIAAASIIARSELIQINSSQKKYWQVNLPFGHKKTLKEADLFVEKHGLQNLRHVAKLSFKNTRYVNPILYEQYRRKSPYEQHILNILEKIEKQMAEEDKESDSSFHTLI